MGLRQLYRAILPVFSLVPPLHGLHLVNVLYRSTEPSAVTFLQLNLHHTAEVALYCTASACISALAP